MATALADVDLALAAMVVALVLTLIGLREAALRRIDADRRFRPDAQRSMTGFLFGQGPVPAFSRRGERQVFLAVAEEALADLTGEERGRLATLLGQLGFTRDALLGLKARSAAARRRSAETLATIAESLSARQVASALADTDVLVRTTCACTAAETGADTDVPAIIAVARRDARAAPGAAASVVLAIAQYHPAALPGLLDADAPEVIRLAAVTITAELRLAQFTDLLVACLDQGTRLAIAAARGIGRIGEFSASAALANLAADHGRTVQARAAAAAALGAIGDPASLGVLRRLLAEPDWTLSDAAARALSRLGEPGLTVLRDAAASGVAPRAALAQAALSS